jgi:hypothetical protein
MLVLVMQIILLRRPANKTNGRHLDNGLFALILVLRLSPKISRQRKFQMNRRWMRFTIQFNHISTMTRFTSIGMGRKTFVASAAEEAQKPAATDEAVAGPSKEKKDNKKDKKRTRDDGDKGGPSKGWKRDPEIASESL